MLSYLDYLVFLHAVVCTEQLYAFRRITFSMFLQKKSLKKLAHFAWAVDLPKWRIFKMLPYLDYLVFLHAVFCTENLYAFRRIIFSMFLRKKKLKITCPFCMGYRLTKMEDLQNALISRLFGVFARGCLHRTTLCIPQNHFQHVFAKKKVENNLLILHGLQTYQNGGSSKCCHISTIQCFCTWFFAQNNSTHSVESFSACFCEKKLKITCPFCMGYRLTKMEDLQNAVTSRLFGVFARGFLHRTTLCIPQNHFQHVFAKKKVENNLPILHGLQTYQNGGSSKCSHISTIWCFCTPFFAQNNSINSVESFSACFCEKKS